MRRLREIWQAARVRHALIAAALALFCGALGLLSPLNGQWWGVQSLAVQRPASGEIIFVGAASDWKFETPLFT